MAKTALSYLAVRENSPPAIRIFKLSACPTIMTTVLTTPRKRFYAAYGGEAQSTSSFLFRFLLLVAAEPFDPNSAVSPTGLRFLMQLGPWRNPAPPSFARLFRELLALRAELARFS